jgi:hypothetical protein
LASAARSAGEDAMPDDPKKTGPADDKRINIHQDHEVRYWTNKFGCSGQELIDCVNRVGVMVDDVRRCLGK